MAACRPRAGSVTKQHASVHHLRHRLPSLGTLALLALAATLLAVDFPGWWTTRGVLQLDPQTLQPRSPDDYAVLNQGQLKNLALAAAAEFDAYLPGGAGAQITALLDTFSEVNELGIRVPKLTASTDDFAAANLGQLKAVARPFYERLAAAGFGAIYPWTGLFKADDFAVANLGQAKMFFNFDFAVDLPADHDGDGLPSLWEVTHGLDPFDEEDAFHDLDGDGYVALSEFENGTDPNDYFNGNLPSEAPLRRRTWRPISGETARCMSSGKTIPTTNPSSKFLRNLAPVS